MSDLHLPARYDGDLDELLARLHAWLRSEQLAWLFAHVPAFVPGSDPPSYLRRPAGLDAADPIEAIRALRDLNIEAPKTAWDFREGKERDAVDEMVAYGDRAGEIVRVAADLGLQRSRSPEFDRYTVGLSLGGLRRAPLERTRWFAEHVEQGLAVEHAVLLGCNRPVTEEERRQTDAYARGAVDEFDLMEAAGRRCGMISGNADIDEVSHEGRRAKSFWHWRAWGGDPRVHVVSSPASRSAATRANTEDSLRFLMRGLPATADWEVPVEQGDGFTIASTGLGLSAGDSAVLFTSAIYTTFQLLDAARVLGLEYGCSVEICGFPPQRIAGTATNLMSATAYVQEVRSTFHASLRLLRALESNDVRTR